MVVLGGRCFLTGEVPLHRCRAKKEQLKRLLGSEPEIQDQIQALTVLCAIFSRQQMSDPALWAVCSPVGVALLQPPPLGYMLLSLSGEAFAIKFDGKGIGR